MPSPGLPDEVGGTRPLMSDEAARERRHSLITVLTAGGANLLIAGAKLAGGLLSGSSAMMSEAAHSFADTLNQAFLLAALRRSSRPADSRHPFGYGKERYFWSLLAAVSVFVLGAGFSVLEGVRALVSPESQGGVLVAYIVLGLGFVLDGTSLVRALWQLRGQAREQDRRLIEHVRRADPTLRAVVFEDSAGVLGVVLAGAGIALARLTGSEVPDAVASLLIAGILVAVAYALGRQNQQLLVGEAVPPEDVEAMRRSVADSDGISGVLELLTMQLGPQEVLLAARVDVDDETRGDELEVLADRVEEHVRSEFPQVRHVFLDPTPGTAA